MNNNLLIKYERGEKIGMVIEYDHYASTYSVEMFQGPNEGEINQITKTMFDSFDLEIHNGYVYNQIEKKICEICKQDVFYNEKKEEYECVIC